MVTLLLTEQLTVLFLMMGCGFVLVKSKIVKSRDSKTLSLISVYLIMPCVIINAFQIDYSKEIQDGFLLALFAAVIIHLRKRMGHLFKRIYVCPDLAFVDTCTVHYAGKNRI